jgi:apolipoprotein N-acyltransferase
MHQIDGIAAQAPQLRIGLVQPNFAYTVNGDVSTNEILRQLRALQAESRRLQRAGAQLLVWSEGSYPLALPRNFEADFAPESLGMIRRGFSVPAIIGTDMYDAPHDEAFNSALLLDEAGRVTGRYDKVRLLAFGEYIPGVEAFPWLSEIVPIGRSHFTAGAGPRVMTLLGPEGQAWRLGPVICYEDILQDVLHRLGELHPNLLVNLTSDSWFGAGAEPWEHLALAVFASVELRVPMVRAVNSGVSAFIDPNGRLVQKTYADDPLRNPRAEDGIVVTVPRMPGSRTVFVAVGNLFAYLCIAATLLLAGAAIRGRHLRQ